MDDAVADRLAGHLAHVLDALATLHALRSDPSLSPECRRAAAYALAEIEVVVASLEKTLGVGRDDWPSRAGQRPAGKEPFPDLRATST
jgi:hypothetical protein